MEHIQESVQNAINSSIESTKQSIAEGLGDFMHYLMKSILMGIINNSKWICMIICLIAMVAYLCGNKKAGKYVPITIVTHFLLQSIKGVI